MALDFPTSPTNGQVFGNFYYDSSITAWRNLGTKNALSSSINDLRATKLSPNYVINGGMDFWQRGTSFPNNAGLYTADRWSPTVGVVMSTVTQDTSVPNPQFNYSLKMAAYANGTATEWAIRQKMERQHITPLIGKIVTASFWYKSTKTSNKVRVFPQAGVGGADVTQTFTVTPNTWTYISYSFSTFVNQTSWTGAVTDIGGYIDIGFADGQALTTSDSFNVTGVQLEVGSQATPFRRAGGTLQGELSACQRYYIKEGRVGVAIADDDFNVNDMQVTFHNTMRHSSPTITVYSGGFDGHHGISPSVWASNEHGVTFQWSGAAYRTIGARANVTFSAEAEL